MSRPLEGKVALVTGASKGIGASIAQHLASEGAAVAVNYNSDEAGASRVVSQIKGKGGKAIAVKASLARESDIGRLFAETKKAFGRLDILVNNAGVYEFVPLDEVTAESFHRMFDVNVLGLILASQEAARTFGDSGGSIVNIGSVASTSAPPNSSVYSATKGAVDAVTKVLAKELGPRGIRVNAINPGMVETEGAVEFTKGDLRNMIESQTPLGRIGLPHDIAPAVAFLASPGAAWITGESLVVAGGYR